MPIPPTKPIVSTLPLALSSQGVLYGKDAAEFVTPLVKVLAEFGVSIDNTVAFTNALVDQNRRETERASLWKRLESNPPSLEHVEGIPLISELEGYELMHRQPRTDEEGRQRSAVDGQLRALKALDKKEIRETLNEASGRYGDVPFMVNWRTGAIRVVEGGAFPIDMTRHRLHQGNWVLGWWESPKELETKYHDGTITRTPYDSMTDESLPKVPGPSAHASITPSDTVIDKPRTGIPEPPPPPQVTIVSLATSVDDPKGLLRLFHGEGTESNPADIGKLILAAKWLADMFPPDITVRSETLNSSRGNTIDPDVIQMAPPYHTESVRRNGTLGEVAAQHVHVTYLPPVPKTVPLTLAVPAGASVDLNDLNKRLERAGLPVQLSRQRNP
ncbi:MAG: hypothetical protein ABH950_09325 [Candidatus Altiarchaeota archaeon]